MVKYDAVHVAIAAPDVLEVSLIKKVADIINKDLYETRLLLAGKIPRIIAHYQTIRTAESVAQALRTLGLVTLVCEDSELRKHSRGFRANTLKFEEDDVLFWDKCGEARRMESRDVFLILKGRMQTYTETEGTKTRMKINLPATVLTGGIPVCHRVKEKTSDLSIHTEYFVRLYDRELPEPRVEIIQYDFDYSSLGVTIAPSSFTNLSTIVAKLGDIFPRAIFDDRLTETFGADVSSTTPRDNIEINCRLLYLYHLAMSNLL